MSLRFTDTPNSGGAAYNIMVFDDPRKKMVLRTSTAAIFDGIGFRFINTSIVNVSASSLFFWYRFTNDGMLIGYYANTSNQKIAIPSPGPMYYVIFFFNFAAYQMKMYVDSLDFKTYCGNNFPYTFDYSVASNPEKVNRIWNLTKLQTLQFKAFKELTVASMLCLPYSFFNTYKFDFEHTMYDTDGDLKPEAKYYPSMLADGGGLSSLYYPQMWRR